MSEYYKFIGSFLGALCLSYLLTPVMAWLALKCGMVDLPDARRIHTTPTPRGGGLAIFIAFHLSIFIALPLMRDEHFIWWLRFLAPSSLLMLVGLLDDVWGLRPWMKLVGQVLAAAFFFHLNQGGFGVVMNIPLPVYADLVLSLLWFVTLTNAFNLIDGLDGLAAGLAAVAALGIAIAFVLMRSPYQAVFALALLGGCLGFLRYNFYPARVFLGDTGSMFLGFTLAAITISNHSKSTFLAAFGIPLLAMGVPLFDTMLAVWRRSLRYIFPQAFHGLAKPGGIMTADREHLHHRFLGLGVKQHHVAILLYTVSVVMVLTGILSMIFQTQTVGIFLIAFVAWVYISVRHLARAELLDTGQVLLYGLRRPHPHVVASLMYPVIDAVFIIGALAVALWAMPPPNHTVKPLFILLWPYWSMPIFIALALSKVYRQVWALARLNDYLRLLLTIVIGSLCGFALIAIMHPSLRADCVRPAVAAGILAMAGMLAVRVLPRALQEFIADLMLSHPGPAARDFHPTLVYGAQFSTHGLLHHLARENSHNNRKLRVVGLIDDDPNLRDRNAYHLPILGSGAELKALIAAHHIRNLVVVRSLPPERREALRQMALATGIKISFWREEEHPE